MRLTRPFCIPAILLTCVGAWATPYDCGPFLLQPGTETMTIVVDHAQPVDARLTWHRADGRGKKGVINSATSRHHIFTLDDLEPDTRYAYRLKGDGLDSGKREFRTLPEAPSSYRFITLGDVRSLPDVWHAVSERIYENEKEALFIVGTGDYPADGTQYSQWIDQFFSPARNLLASVPMWPSIGNHERTKQFAVPPSAAEEEDSHYFSLFELPGNEHWYRVDYRYVTLLIIDSNSQMQPGHEQYEWLLEQLRSPRERFTIAAFHHAPLTSGPHGRRHEDGTPREWPIDQAIRFVVPLFEMYGVDLVLNGHDHLYERSVKDGVTYVVTGGGGAPLYKVNSVENLYQQVAVSTNHYLAVDVSAAKLAMTAIDTEGEVIDRFDVPVGAATRRRMNGGWLQKLMGTIEFHHEGARSKAAIRNVLDFDVDVELAIEGAQSKKMVVAAGTGAATEIDVVASEQDLAKPPWRGRIALPMTMRLTGEGDGIPFESTVSTQAVLREASFTVRAMPAPQIDGDLTDWPSDGGMLVDANSQTILSPRLYAGDDDMRTRIQAGWSPAGLHLLFRVDDDDLVNTPGAAAYDVDGIEVYIDGRAETLRTNSYDDYVSQNVLPALRPGSSAVGTNTWGDGFTWAAQQRDGGYDLEVTFPYERIRNRVGAVPAVGDTIRFDVMVNDRDRSGGISHHRLWSTGGASRDPSGFGVLLLGN